MTDLFLQLWGGLFYLVNKALFALSEGRNKQSKKQLKTYGWIIYILGVPAWVIILSFKHNWIAASIEAGGLPAMLLGLYNVYTDHSRPQRFLNGLAAVSTYTFIILGCTYSLYDFGGITSLSQILEIGVMVGFLLGSYLLAQNKNQGWLFFMLMNTSMGTLMLLQNKPILAFQQGVSLCFVIYGYLIATKGKQPTLTGKN
ncbi:MAG: nicotinamide mononucleotide transporter [Desulfuromonadales bacterium]|nr:nicotinamide mononucleotide transporter [Desulfuromonadales bacterium]MBN2791475.1 nicotinamide mononucleotide transporter [Desulfuromonadales bacterium]